MYLAKGGLKNRIAKEFHLLFCHQHWNVGFVEQPIHAFLEEDNRPLVRWFPSKGKDKFLADPFGIQRKGRMYIFCEEFDYATMKGVISCIELLDGGVFSKPKVVMDLPFHLAYPFLFEWLGDIYCVPETQQAGEIGLYKAEQFPGQWTKAATLVPDFRGVDNTVFPHEGRWWLICTRQGGPSNEKLFVFHAPGPFGPWHPHAKNPVKWGLFSTRPAGTPFVWRGHLYRPAMDNSRVYGKRIVLNQVKKLTPTDFEEEPAGFVEPPREGPFRDGIHTLSSAGNLTIVDGFRVTFQKADFMTAMGIDRYKLLTWVNSLLHKESGDGSQAAPAAL